jgi:hypothetical protein
MAGGFLALACSASDIDPIGSLAASAPMVLIFHKGLQQSGLQALATQPIFGNLLSSEREDL